MATTYGIPIAIVSTAVGLAKEGGGLLDIHGRPIRESNLRALQSVDPSAPPLEFAQAMPMLAEMMEEREQWIQRQHRVNDIPLDITQNRDDQMSGVSRALLARPAIDRIEAAHRQIAKALNGAVEAVTDGAGGIGEIQWPRQPFDSLAERRIIAREYYIAGLMTLNEARQYIDLEPVPGGDKFYSETMQEQQEEPNADD